MEVRFWIAPSVTKSHMAEDANASPAASFFPMHPSHIQLPAGQSFFIVGGRNSIVKEIIRSCQNVHVTVAQGPLHVSFKTSRGFRKVKRLVQIHGAHDGPGAGAKMKFGEDTIRLGMLREALENVMWGSQM